MNERYKIMVFSQNTNQLYEKTKITSMLVYTYILFEKVIGAEYGTSSVLWY